MGIIRHLAHYGTSPLARVRSVEQVDQLERAMKPSGLWVSVEGKGSHGWKQWCLAEGFHPEHLACKTRVILKPNARICHLETVEQIDGFTKRFLHQWDRMPDSTLWLNWAEVAKHWQGIIIAPYQWERRMDMSCSWYYGWDCASGCIWDADAIKALRPATSRKKELV
jgi:hypothetical protein